MPTIVMLFHDRIVMCVVHQKSSQCSTNSGIEKTVAEMGLCVCMKRVKEVKRAIDRTGKKIERISQHSAKQTTNDLKVGS